MTSAIESVHRWLDRAPAALPGSFAGVLIAAVGLVDWMTGRELSASVFYVIPVGVAAWYAGAAWGLGTCLLAAAAWYARRRSRPARRTRPRGSPCGTRACGSRSS